MNNKVKAVCIDDFAIKKRQRYGTIMVDADSGRIMDMIETRETEEVSVWLSKYPNIRFVSRDGSQSYATAITKGLPNAIQISDRFHLLQGVCDRANKCFQRIFQGRIPIPITSESERRRQILSLGTVEEKRQLVRTLRNEGRTVREIEAMSGMPGKTINKYLKMKELPVPNKKYETIRGKEHKAAIEKTQARADLVRKLKAEGMSIGEISRRTGFTYNTAQVYLSDDFSPVSGHYGKQREGKLYCFRENVLKMRAEGKTYSQIYDKIRMEGYTGTVDAIRGFVSKERRLINDIQSKSGIGQTELIEKKWIVQLLYKPFSKIPALTLEQFAAVLKEYPASVTILRAVNRFKGILKRRDTEALKKWIDDTATLELEELSSFANGLKNDLTAVLNAFSYDYNNGIAEGNVNKVKVIKRIMYGRCSFSLLKIQQLPAKAGRLDND